MMYFSSSTRSCAAWVERAASLHVNRRQSCLIFSSWLKGLELAINRWQPCSVSTDIYEVIKAGSGSFRNAHTFSSHPAACAAGLATLTRLTDDGLISQVAIKGEQLTNALRSRLSDHPYVGDLRGRGLLLGIELVADRERKTPFAPEKALFHVVEHQALDAGLICYPMSGTLDGVRGDHILLAPPFIIDENHIAEIADKLSIAIDRAVAAIR